MRERSDPSLGRGPGRGQADDNRARQQVILADVESPILVCNAAREARRKDQHSVCRTPARQVVLGEQTRDSECMRARGREDVRRYVEASDA